MHSTPHDVSMHRCMRAHTHTHTHTKLAYKLIVFVKCGNA